MHVARREMLFSSPETVSAQGRTLMRSAASWCMCHVAPLSMTNARACASACKPRDRLLLCHLVRELKSARPEVDGGIGGNGSGDGGDGGRVGGEMLAPATIGSLLSFC